MKRLLAATVAVMLGVPVSAHAVIVDASTDLPPPVTDAAALQDPTSTSGFVRVDFVGNNFDGISPSALSPYAGTVFEDAAVYHSVSAGAEARYAFDRPQDGLGFVFGSPDSYNWLSFLLDGVNVFNLLGDSGDIVPPGTPGLGAVYVLVSDILFDELRFASSGDAFEFTNLSTTEPSLIPVPASLPLLLAGIAGFILLGRRRRSAA